MNASYVLKPTRSGHTTCDVTMNEKSIFLHSLYDPIKESRAFIQNHIKEIKGKKRVIVYGIGCGYHIIALLEALEDDQELKIDVWDFNVDLYEFLKKEKQLEAIVSNARITLHITNDRKKIIDYWSQVNENTDYILIHPASLAIIPTEYSDLKTALEIFQINTNNILVHKDTLNKQFDMNVKKANMDKMGILYNLLSNMPTVLVAAGPSLEKNFDFLKRYKNKVLIGAVGNALGPLIDHDIVPDFFVLTDSYEELYKQFYKIDKNIQKIIPLFYLGTVAPNVVDMYEGIKIMLLQEELEKAKNLAMELGVIPVKTGGSVATMLLDFSIYLGAKQVCFVGQDLAFTNNKTHIDGAMGYKEMTVDHYRSALLEIDDYFLQGKVSTPKNLYIYKKWIENYIEEHQEIQFFNATQGGAYIRGCIHVPFEEFIKSISFTEDIDFLKEKFKKAIKYIIDNQ